MNKVYLVILAGGKGERLWPLSRSALPKQLLSFVDNISLLEHTIRRLKTISFHHELSIITTHEQYELIKDSVGHLVDALYIEPASRNTAPAILYTCNAIYEKDPQALIAFIPADHYIEDAAAFIASLEKALRHAAQAECITLLGVRPTFPATGYGYIEYLEQEHHDIMPIKSFHEKPTASMAAHYLTNPTMLWNIGIFAARASFFIEEFKQTAPELYAQFACYQQGALEYSALTSISIDYAVIEKSASTMVLPVSFKWSDVGNLDTFLSLKLANNKIDTTIIAIESQNNIVASKKLTALIGVENLCIVETDDAILIAKRDDVEKVKLILQELKATHHNQYL